MALMVNDPSTSLPIDGKAALRKDALRRRTAAFERLGAVCAEPVKELGLQLIERLAGRIVSGYMPIRDELDPLPLMTALAASGRVLTLPVIETKWAPLIFRSWSLGEPLRTASFGLRVPLATAPSLEPEILLVPMTAFDSAGYRIGYGGGYYDRTLALFRANRKVTAIGIAFDEQEVPMFRHEAHDQRMDFLVTPTGVRTFGV